jgi:ketosteroid isomerase-like protein/broad specificity phosphatase PhoE
VSQRDAYSFAATIVALALLPLSARADTPCERGATTILIVRHAERPGQADSITVAGSWRARALAHVAGSAGIQAIYRSDTKRNQLTAEPIAKELGLTPVVYAAKDNDALVTRIFAEHEGGTVLVLGHSNTVPKIIAAAGGPTIPDLPDDEFDRLYVVVVPPCRRGPATLVQLQYGAASPPPAPPTPSEPEPAPLPSVTLPPELARVLTDYEAAWKNGDETALANLFAEDGFVLISGGLPVRGREAIARVYKDMGGSLSLRALEWSTQGDTGYIIGGYAGAKGDKDVGKFTLTLKRAKDGRWLIMSDMDNLNRR